MKRHDTDVTSLVFGLLFVGVSVLWFMVHQQILTLPTLGVAAPVLLIAIGLAGVLGSLTKTRRDRDDPSLPSDQRP